MKKVDKSPPFMYENFKLVKREEAKLGAGMIYLS